MTRNKIVYLSTVGEPVDLYGRPWEDAPLREDLGWEEWTDQEWRDWYAAMEEDWRVRNGE